MSRKGCLTPGRLENGEKSLGRALIYLTQGWNGQNREINKKVKSRPPHDLGLEQGGPGGPGGGGGREGGRERFDKPKNANFSPKKPRKLKGFSLIFIFPYRTFSCMEVTSNRTFPCMEPH